MSNERGCGSRVVGGVYAEVKNGTGGSPIEAFLVDPPKAVDVQILGLTDKGVRLIELGGVWHVFDIVGEKHYPYVADFVEEGRRMGISRRLPQNLDFEKLDPVQSRLVLLHRKALITNVLEAGFLERYHVCPKALPEHEEGLLDGMCAAFWWQDFAAKALDADGIRTMKNGGQYVGRLRPQGRAKPERELAVFMSLPITNLAVIRGRNTEETARVQEVYEKIAKQSKFEVNLEDE
ncbi:MAG: hypothetical protein HN855_00220 [Anaerolineae bacterium]|jgi:hypothetical protein|nr:hypothetical protein [Anaerolineae bacterium]MBT7323565.1 hypothetical protein [Anaerolineae bacterium]